MRDLKRHTRILLTVESELTAHTKAEDLETTGAQPVGIAVKAIPESRNFPADHSSMVSFTVQEELLLTAFQGFRSLRAWC